MQPEIPTRIFLTDFDGYLNQKTWPEIIYKIDFSHVEWFLYAYYLTSTHVRWKFLKLPEARRPTREQLNKIMSFVAFKNFAFIFPLGTSTVAGSSQLIQRKFNRHNY